MGYSGTTWQTRTKISTEIAETMDDGIQKGIDDAAAAQQAAEDADTKAQGALDEMVQVDDTLLNEGEAADAKATGEAINDVTASTQASIESEVNAREAAMEDEVTARDKAISDEASARKSADDDLAADIKSNTDLIDSLSQSLSDITNILQVYDLYNAEGDLNDSLYSDSYKKVSVLVCGSNVANRPKDDSCLVFSYGSNYGVQLFISNGGQYIRRKMAGEWRSWELIYSFVN